jgi:hypothetical protein
MISKKNLKEQSHHPFSSKKKKTSLKVFLNDNLVEIPSLIPAQSSLLGC